MSVWVNKLNYYSIDPNNWSAPAVISSDVKCFPFSVALFGNLCTVTVLNVNMNFVNWHQVRAFKILLTSGNPANCQHQSFSNSPKPRPWVEEVVRVAAPNPPTSPISLKSSIYMELTAIKDDSYTPMPLAQAEIGCDSFTSVLVNGNLVRLGTQFQQQLTFNVDGFLGIKQQQVTFNEAGLLGIEVPMNIFGKLTGVLTFPNVIPPVIW
jgi:hypothetical protein